MFRDSVCHEIIEINAEAQIVAQACIEVIKSMGSITKVSRETGTVSGKLSRRPNPLANPVTITLVISKNGTKTQVSITTSRKEGLATSGGAHKGLNAFLEELGNSPELVGKTSAGW